MNEPVEDNNEQQCSMDTSSLTHLDVFLRGTRDYVQGSQLIARVAEIAGENTAVLCNAAFSRISKNRIAAQCGGEGTAGVTPIGVVSFLVSGSVRTYTLHEVEEAAPRRNDSMGVSVKLIEKCPSSGVLGKLSADFGFDCAADFEGILNVIVQSTKSLHETLGPSVKDIWFTGIRKFPLDRYRCIGSGLIRIRGKRIMRQGSQYQSLLSVALLDPKGDESCDGYVTFAFKSDKVIDVD